MAHIAAVLSLAEQHTRKPLSWPVKQAVTLVATWSKRESRHNASPKNSLRP
jgi:hypothetical protein